ATRQTDMCVYHPRWREVVSDLLTYRKTMPYYEAQKIISCSCSDVPANEKCLHKLLICPRDAEDQLLDNIDCLAQRCSECKDLQELESESSGAMGTMCARRRLATLAATARHICFLPVCVLSPSAALCCVCQLPRGRVGLVIDVAENYTHAPRFEHQSRYFSQVQTTILPIVLMFRVEDLVNIASESERSDLIALFNKHKLAHVISETQFIISADMQHDQAMVQKVLDDKIVPYIAKAAPRTTHIEGPSDGCMGQFKNAAYFHWVSSQLTESCGLISGLAKPKRSLTEKKGKGIYRRFFYWVPSKGVGAVDRSRLPKFVADGTSKLHEFLDIGRYKDIGVMPKEIKIQREAVPAAATARMDRAALDREAQARSANLYEAVQPGSNVLTFSDQVVEVAARRVRVVGVQLTIVRSCGRLATSADGTAASIKAACAD
ncbi:MAG: hypothetical protein SGPRY_002356, partial [Prymnesium sp.]